MFKIQRLLQSAHSWQCQQHASCEVRTGHFLVRLRLFCHLLRMQKPPRDCGQGWSWKRCCHLLRAKDLTLRCSGGAAKPRHGTYMLLSSLQSSRFTLSEQFTSQALWSMKSLVIGWRELTFWMHSLLRSLEHSRRDTPNRKTILKLPPRRPEYQPVSPFTQIKHWCEVKAEFCSKVCRRSCARILSCKARCLRLPLARRSYTAARKSGIFSVAECFRPCSFLVCTSKNRAAKGIYVSSGQLFSSDRKWFIN